MADHTISFAAKRAEKAKGCRLWTPLDCLHDTVREVENGEWKDVERIFIAMELRVSSNTTRFPYSCAGSRRIELMGLLAQHMNDLASV